MGTWRSTRANRDLLLAALPRMGLGTIAPPDGAFYFYVDVGRFTDNSLQLCQQLLEETGVALAPGIDFDPVDGHRFIRLSFAVSTPQVTEAIDRLTAWFARKNARIRVMTAHLGAALRSPTPH